MAGSEFSRKDALARVDEARRAGDIDALVNIATRESDWIVRVVAIGDLGHLQAPSAVEPLRRLLNSEGGPVSNVRVASIRALARIGDMSVSDDLYRLATDDRCPRGI